VPDHRLPNLIIAGVTKAGTTSLFNYLSQHPKICPSDVKETRYFYPLRFGGSLQPIETYAAHFRHCQDESYAVEATPAYFYGGRPIAAAIRNVLPDARVLLLLRSPSDRCWSYFRFEKSRARIPADMDFDTYLDHCEKLRDTGADGLWENRAYMGLIGGCYANWMEEWSAELAERLRVVYFDDLSSDASATVKGICCWLGVDDEVVDTFDLAVENKTVQVRSDRAQLMALVVNRRTEHFFRRHATAKRRLRSLYYLVNREPADLTPSTAAATRMAKFYEPYDATLAVQMESMGIARPPWVLAAS